MLRICYSCSYSRLEPTRANDDYFCANETLILMDKELTQRPCAAWEKYCVTTIETSLNAFSSIARSCNEACRVQCESDGYGTDMVRCDDCCETDNCNGNFSVHYYLEVMQAQYTSWVEPMQNERSFNKAQGFHFPYGCANSVRKAAFNIILSLFILILF
ncbi:unnamed protein product [Dracunculus medinensis]|uniref:Uncharacterized protein n=1 Tax=Dracunculus medinensis TaxID=318479 RepID=A0A3P7Q1J0_DRAME|nr:unnamed protein product [Dracunculus medinensis]